ncbi:hypothetical protein C1634_018095 [Chryseobacterium viscerum]|uniref:RHS repeat-associated core domain-containing protein n=1 Tax=Chryseobacterium viscerum TaxID=1037377 RepID=A0A316WN33_9FLAO|nr:hypothetical protein C1634_018095 [Chryseobacterium viscerum]
MKANATVLAFIYKQAIVIIWLPPYNYLNLPGKVIQNSKVTDYIYRADGVKVKKVFGTETTDYLDGFQYTDSVLKFFPTAEGYFNVETGKYVYNYTDHLGNTRLSYAKNGAGTEIIEESNYYPFGLKHEGYNFLTGNPAYKYKYQGQELQETGMYSFKWREYMPDVGRFIQIDPLSEKFPYNSTYAFQENKLGMGREFEGLELVPFEFLMMSNSNIPTTPLTEAMIREVPIEGITLVGRATPPPQIGFWEKIGNAISKGWDSITGSNKAEPAQTMDKVTENAKPESVAEQVKPEGQSSQYDKIENSSRGKEGVANRQTDISKEEFGKNLEKSGYEKTEKGGGKVAEYKKGDQSYTIRPDKGGKPTADFRKSPESKQADIKIRLKPETGGQ